MITFFINIAPDSSFHRRDAELAEKRYFLPAGRDGEGRPKSAIQNPKP